MIIFSFSLLSLLLLGLVGFLLVHHAMKHDGTMLDKYDVTQSILALTTKHEGWIILILIFILGMTFGRFI